MSEKKYSARRFLLRQWAFFVAAMLVLLLTGVLWIRSLVTIDTVWFCTFGGQFNMVQSSNGIVAMTFTGRYIGPDEAFVIRHFSSLLDTTGDEAIGDFSWSGQKPTNNPEPWVILTQPFRVESAIVNTTVPVHDATTALDAAGICVMVGTTPEHAMNALVLTLPYWLFAAIALLAAILRLKRLRRATVRYRRGGCVRCGYNVLHTAGFCPECGMSNALPTREKRSWKSVGLIILIVVALTFVAYVVGRSSKRAWYGAYHEYHNVSDTPILPTTVSIGNRRTFAEFFSILQNRFNVRMDVDWEATRSAGMFRRTLLLEVVRSNNLPAILSAIEARFQNNVGYAGMGDHVRVTSMEQIFSQQQIRVYDISDLVRVIETIPEPEKTWMLSKSPRPEPDRRIAAAHRTAGKIVDRLREFLMRKNWHSSCTIIAAKNNNLIVQHSEEGHKMIVYKLSEMRRQARAFAGS